MSMAKKVKGKMNKQWHQKHHMLKNPSIEEKIKWHLEHAKNCTCRPIPAGIKAEIAKRR